jgi:putative ABC transport system ATP-binding protein
VLRAEGLSYSYREAGRDHPLFADLDLDLAAGERVALVGASGCGKSTLLNLLGTIDSPDGGSIRIGGTEVVGLREPERTLFRREHLGFVYQRFLLIPTLTVGENVRLPLDLLGLDAGETGVRVASALDAVGLADRSESFPDHLSGGEQQRVAIARALVHRPRVLLADEPTGSLDASTAEQVLDLLLDQTAAAAGTLLLVTHSEAVAARADRVLALEDGKLVPR